MKIQASILFVTHGHWIVYQVDRAVGRQQLLQLERHTSHLDQIQVVQLDSQLRIAA
ncbi:hypothetical protein D3C73_1589950 [compost metagenome]